MGATKEQERKALVKIRKIVEELGEGSYVGTAFEGCFRDAEDNIEDDAAYSMKARFEYSEERLNQARKELRDTRDAADRYSNELERAREEIEILRRRLEAEQEWEDYEMKGDVTQSDYENLAKQADTRFLTDDEAKDILYDWYGFAKEKVVIHKSAPTYQKNRHGQVRRKGEVDRSPAYFATDWNYIRFECGSMTYELYNDTLSFSC